MTAPPLIRDAAAVDLPAFVPLWNACLLMHGVQPNPIVTERTWDLVMQLGSTLGMRVALLKGQIVGFAIHSHQPNSWTGGEDGCLDTLFVAPQARWRGLGRLMKDDLLSVGRARGWRTVFWHVKEDNLVARALYKCYDAEDGFRYRILLPTSPES